MKTAPPTAVFRWRIVGAKRRGPTTSGALPMGCCWRNATTPPWALAHLWRNGALTAGAESAPQARVHRTRRSINSELLSAAGIKRVDFLIGGPPCQPFSIAGKRGGTRDERASLLDHYVRLVRELKPKAFLLENVPNLTSIDDGRILKRRLFGPHAS
jgi:C-5 cytosine-specific DNA methylase